MVLQFTRHFCPVLHKAARIPPAVTIVLNAMEETEMESGPGYWLDPRDGEVYEVDTHNDWLLRSENQQQLELPSRYVQVLNALDPIREIDEIRMVGVMFGVIRVRDYRRHLSIQFFSSRDERVSVNLDAIVDALPKLIPGQEHYLVIHNLSDDSYAKLWSGDFIDKVKAGSSVLLPAEGVLEYNEALRQKMKSLLVDLPP